jgi:hypothetical protein
MELKTEENRLMKKRCGKMEGDQVLEDSLAKLRKPSNYGLA